MFIVQLSFVAPSGEQELAQSYKVNTISDCCFFINLYSPKYTVARGVDPGGAPQYFAKGAMHQSGPSNRPN